MGNWVHIHVCFPCGDYDGVAEYAGKHLPDIPEEYIYKEAREFLLHLTQRSGDVPGTKSGLCLWGYVGNYTMADEFAEVLRPFWEDILRDDEDWKGPAGFERILIFWQNEEWSKAKAIEIYWDDNRSPTRNLIIRQHNDLPFSWQTWE